MHSRALMVPMFVLVAATACSQPDDDVTGPNTNNQTTSTGWSPDPEDMRTSVDFLIPKYDSNDALKGYNFYHDYNETSGTCMDAFSNDVWQFYVPAAILDSLGTPFTLDDGVTYPPSTSTENNAFDYRALSGSVTVDTATETEATGSWTFEVGDVLTGDPPEGTTTDAGTFDAIICY